MSATTLCPSRPAGTSRALPLVARSLTSSARSLRQSVCHGSTPLARFVQAFSIHTTDWVFEALSRLAPP